MSAHDRKPPAGREQAVPRVDGIVLAAGRSSRMGRDKAALELGGSTFLERAAATLRDGGCQAIVAVTSESQSANLPMGVAAAINPDPGSQQIVSIRIGIAALSGDTDAVVILPVDAPAVRADTVSRLIQTFRAIHAPIVRPIHDGRPGHPTLFARAVFEELAESDLPRGAESVVERHATDRVDVPVDDAAIAQNVNTPEDYNRLRGDE